MGYGPVTLDDGRKGELQDVFTSCVTGRQLAMVRINGELITVDMKVVH